MSIAVREIHLIVPNVMNIDPMVDFSDSDSIDNPKLKLSPAFAARTYITETDSSPEYPINLAKGWGFCVRKSNRWRIIIYEGTPYTYKAKRDLDLAKLVPNSHDLRTLPPSNILVSERDAQKLREVLEGTHNLRVVYHKFKGKLNAHTYI